jgi:HEPN domain-containing protein
VEKYLKALLAVHNVNYPKIHDVSELAELSAEFCPNLRTLPFDASEFNPFAVTIRYDDWDEDVPLELLKEMFDKCNQVRALIIEVLPETVRP